MRILVPVDFRYTSFNAYCYANALAARLNAEITLLFVIKERSNIELYLDHQLLSYMKMHSAGLLEDFATNYPKSKGVTLQDVPLDFAVQLGVPGKIITEVAETRGFDLIVMGIRDKLNFMSRITGTTSTSVMNHVDIPIIMVHADSPISLPKKIAFAFDQKKDLDDGIEDFKKLNNTLKVTTDFIHISPDPARQSDQSNKSINVLFDDADLHFSFDIKNIYADDILQKLYDYCKSQSIDLLTMIHKKDGIIDLLFNQSKTIKTAYDFHTPLLVLPA